MSETRKRKRLVEQLLTKYLDLPMSRQKYIFQAADTIEQLMREVAAQKAEAEIAWRVVRDMED